MGMKICANCKAQVNESAKFCVMCGKQDFIEVPQQPQYQPEGQPSQPQGWQQPQYQYQGKPPKMGEVARSPKFGIAGFILSLFGLIGIPFWSLVHALFICFLSVPSLAFSIPGLGKKRKCKWMAIVGILFCVISLILFGLKIYYGRIFVEEVSRW